MLVQFTRVLILQIRSRFWFNYFELSYLLHTGPPIATPPPHPQLFLTNMDIFESWFFSVNMPFQAHNLPFHTCIRDCMEVAYLYVHMCIESELHTLVNPSMNIFLFSHTIKPAFSPWLSLLLRVLDLPLNTMYVCVCISSSPTWVCLLLPLALGCDPSPPTRHCKRFDLSWHYARFFPPRWKCFRTQLWDADR